jgi:4-hydroxybenzoate polyprenyltransferase
LLRHSSEEGRRPGLRTFVSLLRPFHWIKNGFVLAPVLFTFWELPFQAVVASLCAMVAFCFASSCAYVHNDLVDQDRDRHHPQKRLRPIASGAVSPRSALVLFGISAAISAALCIPLPWHVAAIIAAYVALNIAYTWWLKRIVLIDVMSIAAGFMLRILAGGASAGVALSPWMLHTTFFISLFLGFTKRMSELVTVSPAGRRHVLKQYSRGFLTLMVGMFVALTIMTYSLYVFFPHRSSAAAGQGLVYTVPLVAYGLLRYLYLVMHRREGGDVADAVRRDVPLMVCIGLWVIVVAALVGLRL